MKCTAKCKDGSHCSNSARAGYKRCASHSRRKPASRHRAASCGMANSGDMVQPPDVPATNGQLEWMDLSQEPMPYMYQSSQTHPAQMAYLKHTINQRRHRKSRRR